MIVIYMGVSAALVVVAVGVVIIMELRRRRRKLQWSPSSVKGLAMEQTGGAQQVATRHPNMVPGRERHENTPRQLPSSYY
jgi:hypothetical protein